MKSTLFAFVALASALACWPASASPWLLRPGDLIVVGRYDFESADEEYLDNTTAQPFPLAGRYDASTFSTTLRYGLLEDLELELYLPIKQLSYSSDPVIVVPTTEADAFDYYQENILDFSQSVRGLADIHMAARYQLFRSAVAGAFELRLKTPTGYDKPTGTFGNRPKSREEFIARAEELTRPSNIQDDVALGDGQLDLTPSILLGWATASGTFARLDLGYRLRFGGAGDQVIGGLRVGQSIGRRLLIYGGADLEYAVQQGRIIGISVAAVDPTLPAEDYDSPDNFLFRELRLERDQLSVSGGAIFRATQSVEFNLGYTQTVWGRNTAQVRTVSVSIGIRTNILSPPDP